MRRPSFLLPSSMAAVSLLVCALAAGCGGPRSWSPVLLETNTTFLTDSLTSVRSQVDTARRSLPADPATADAALEQASHELGHLLHYYLPLFQAREHALNAYRLHSIGENLQALKKLDRIEEILEAVGREEPDAGDAMDEPLGLAVSARSAVQSGRSDAPEKLERLAWTLDNLALRGGLVVD